MTENNEMLLKEKQKTKMDIGRTQQTMNSTDLNMKGKLIKKVNKNNNNN